MTLKGIYSKSGWAIHMGSVCRKKRKMQIRNVCLGTEDTGTKTLKEILLSKNDSETLGQKPKQSQRLKS